MADVMASPRQAKDGQKSGRSAAVDNKANSRTPLDFSFMEIVEMGDIETEQPRESWKKKPQKVLVEREGEDPVELYDCGCVWLRNNHLAEVPTLCETLKKVIVDPMAITWVDLSFNRLTKIDANLCDLQHLHILYLHGNDIGELTEVDKLVCLPDLHKLTLHGNPISEKKNYRWYVLSMVCNLKCFDMSSVTKGDRVTASIWQQANVQKKKKPQKD